MWEPETTADCERQTKWYAKKHPRELRAVLSNAKTYLNALRNGALPQAKCFGFLHPEPHGVWAVTEKGGHGKGLAATRYYVYPDADTDTLYQITIGDKRSQPDDIIFCSEFVEGLRRLKEQNQNKVQDQNEQAKSEPAEGGEKGGEGEKIP
jgi:hypothetical protein